VMMSCTIGLVICKSITFLSVSTEVGMRKGGRLHLGLNSRQLNPTVATGIGQRASDDQTANGWLFLWILPVTRGSKDSQLTSSY
jgi:hypothetical protein